MAPWMRWNALQVLQGSVRRQEVLISSTDAPVQTWLWGGALLWEERRSTGSGARTQRKEMAAHWGLRCPAVRY